MTRRISFKYFLISNGYGTGQEDESLVYLSEKGLLLLDQLLKERETKNILHKQQKEKSVKHG